MNLKKVYTISVDEELAKKIEKIKEETSKSYTEIFIDALKEYWGLEK